MEINPSTPRSRRAHYVPKWPAEEFIVPLLQEAIEQFLAVKMTKVPGEHVLDVGCGSQPFRSQLEANGYSYTGFDIQQNQYNSVDHLGRIDTELPQSLQNARFELIICTEVMEHVAEWNTAFENLAKLLAPGGEILITCPHFYHLHEEPHDYWRPTPYALSYFADKYGLRIVDQRRLGDGWDVLGTALANIHIKRKGRFSIRHKLLKMVARWLFRNLKSRQLQACATASGPLYLSNFVVLEKP